MESNEKCGIIIKIYRSLKRFIYAYEKFTLLIILIHINIKRKGVMKIMSEIIREKIADGVYFNFIPDNRFKTIRITASLFLPITKETASANALAQAL